jgi:plastocyanin
MRVLPRLHRLIAFAAPFALWSCGGGDSNPVGPSNPQPPPAAQTVSVNIVGSIGNSAYSPNPVNASAGDIVVFRNNDASVHHIVLDNGSMDFGALTPGATSRGLTLQNGSALNFHCMNHPSMVGAINGARPDPPPCPDPYGYGC